MPVKKAAFPEHGKFSAFAYQNQGWTVPVAPAGHCNFEQEKESEVVFSQNCRTGGKGNTQFFKKERLVPCGKRKNISPKTCCGHKVSGF